MEKKSVVEKFKIHYNRGTKKQKTREVLFMEAKDRVYQALCRMAKSDCQITAAALAEELNLSRKAVWKRHLPGRYAGISGNNRERTCRVLSVKKEKK